MVHNKIELVRQFMAHVNLPDILDEQQISYVTYQLWRKYFWNVHIKKWIPFAMCDECTSLFAELMACKTDEERAVVKVQKRNHRDMIYGMRRLHEARYLWPELFPADCLSLIIDAMDNQKTQIPQCK